MVKVKSDFMVKLREDEEAHNNNGTNNAIIGQKRKRD